jgi:Zn finger protein HypA/HybF involved in hydrogenase expression
MVHNSDALLKKCPNCKNEDLENIYGDDAHIWYLEGKLKVAKDQLTLTEKALELACEEMNRIEAKYGFAYLLSNDCLVDYFKTKAKEMMKSE